MHQKRRDSIQLPALGARALRGRRRRLAVLLGCLLFASAPGVARAASIVDTWIVPFVAQPQSIWAPGAPPEFTGPPQGTTQVGGIADGSFVKLELGATGGTVSGNVEGSLSVAHPDVLAHPGLASIDFRFTGNPEESKLKTTMGGGFKVTMGLRLATLIPISLDSTLIDLTILLETDNDYTYSSFSPMDSSVGTLQVAQLGADIIVAGINVNASVQHRIFFTPHDIRGMATATHLHPGTCEGPSGSCDHKVTGGFFANSQNPFRTDLDLDHAGYWNVTLAGLELFDNEFRQSLGGSIGVTIDVFLLGTVFADSIGLDFYNQPEFELAFDKVDLGGGFLIQVLDGKVPLPEDVPEPGSGLLIGLGLLGLATNRRG